jgi:hypothetical protein
MKKKVNPLSESRKASAEPSVTEDVLDPLVPVDEPSPETATARPTKLKPSTIKGGSLNPKISKSAIKHPYIKKY